MTIVERAVILIAAGGIAIVPVDFTLDNISFYQRCGLQTGVEGIRDLGTSAEAK